MPEGFRSEAEKYRKAISLIPCYAKSRAERATSRTGIISEAVMPKRSERPDRSVAQGGGASDFGLTYPSMRSSLFGFTELILLIGLRLFYRKLSCFTFQRRKVNLGRKSFAFLDLVSNKAKLLSRILGVRRCNFDFLSLKEIKKVKNFLSKV